MSMKRRTLIIADCIYCNDAPAVAPDGLCPHCQLAFRAEVEIGMYELRDYLRCDPHVAFAAYCREHGMAA